MKIKDDKILNEEREKIMSEKMITDCLFEVEEGSHLDRLGNKYNCTTQEKPRWMIWGTFPGEEEIGEGVLYWVRPCPEDRFIAGKISQLINQLGGKSEVMSTEKFID